MKDQNLADLATDISDDELASSLPTPRPTKPTWLLWLLTGSAVLAVAAAVGIFINYRPRHKQAIQNAGKAVQFRDSEWTPETVSSKGVTPQSPRVVPERDLTLDEIRALLRQYSVIAANAASTSNLPIDYLDLVAKLQVVSKDDEGLRQTVTLKTKHAIGGSYDASLIYSVAEGQVEIDEMKAAIHTVTKILEPDEKVRRLAQLAQLLATRGDADSANQALTDALNVLNARQSSFWTRGTLSEIGSAQATLGDRTGMRKTIALLNERKADETSNYYITGIYSTIAKTEVIKGDFDAALTTVESLITQGESIQHAHYLLGGIAAGLTKRGKYQEAMAIASRIPDGMPNDLVGVLCEIAKQQARRGDLNAARRTVFRVQSVAMTASKKDYLLERIALLRADIGDDVLAVELCNSIESVSIRSRTLAGIALCQAKTHQWDLTESYKSIGDAIWFLPNDGNDIDLWLEWSYQLVAREQTRLGLGREALKRARDMKQPAPKALSLVGIAEGALMRMGKLRADDPKAAWKE